MDIYGFSTSQLQELLSVKAQRDRPGESMEEFPLLLTKLHTEMANGENEVMQPKKIIFLILF